MRILTNDETRFVAGAGDEICWEICESDGKNNNGYGNGAESGPPPGRSGDHNPQLTSWNSGPRGPR